MSFFEVALWMLVAAALVPAHQAAWRRGDAWLAALLCADLIALAMVAVPVRSEPAWERLAQEDGALEWATAFAFLTAAVLAGRGFSRGAPAMEHVTRVGFILFCVVVAGEEISWGQRLVGFQPPEIFLERNFQQELNVHNVLMDEASGLPFELDSKHLVMGIAIAFGFVLPLLAALRQPLLRATRPLAPPWVLAPWFLAVIAVEETYPVDLTGEGAELFLGVLFALSAAFAGGDGAPRRLMAAAVVPLVLGAVTAPLLARVVFGSDEDGIARARVELAVLAEDLQRGALAKVKKRSGIHKRVFTSTRDGYYDLGASRFVAGSFDGARPGDEARRRYFLDPWNNPYWVLTEKRDDRALVYSFGPNRRRDTNVKQRDRAEGDDVLVAFPLGAPAAANADDDED